MHAPAARRPSRPGGYNGEVTLSPGFRAFAHRDFRLFWAGQLVSLVGTWMQSVAQSWLVLELTNSAFRLGLIGTLQFTPMLLLSFFAGALADRVPKRRLILATQSVLLVQALLLAGLVWHGHVEYWHVAVMATLYGIANTVDMPARQAFIVEMVGKEDLRSAIALNSGMFNGARIVGPAVAGLLIAHWGIAFAFLANALSFVAVIGALLAVRAEGRPHPHVHRTLREDIGEGIAYAVRTPHITLVLSLVLAVSGFLFNYNVLVPLLARDVLNQGARGFGLLMSLLGMGAVAGAVALGARRGHPSVPALVVPALALGAATVCLAAVRDFRVAGALLVVMGFSGLLFMAGANTTLQLAVPDALRGRVMSLHTLMFAGVTPFGAFLVGSITAAFGVPAGFAITGTCGIVAVLALFAWWRAGRRAALPGTP
ncbi:MAG: MFS transporter [Candidatus Rokuibacteriota bacterium]